MAEPTAAEIEAMIASLETAKLARLTGGVRTKVSYTSGSVEKQVASLEEINAEIVRLKVLLGKLTGRATGVGPVRVGFGGRL